MTRKIALVTSSASALALFAALLPAPALADTLQQALEAAYADNPVLTAQRASVRVADEDVPIARSAGLPTIESSATFQENVLKGDPSGSGFFSDPDRQFTAQINADVPLLNFGAVSQSVKAAEERVSVSRLGLRSTQGELFTHVVGAYMDVLRDEAKVELNASNLEVMEFTLKETQERAKAGNRGPTDVAQSEARLALAQSQLETARGTLIASRENYIRLVGHEPGELSAPPALPQFPATPDAAVNVALENNPEYLAAIGQSKAAGHDVSAAHAERYPQLSAIGGVNFYDYLGSLDRGTGPRNGDQGTTGFVGMRLRVPLFNGGRMPAQVRQAQARQSVAIEKALDAERTVVADTRSAYASWRAADLVITYSQAGVDANRRVLQGLRAETAAGFRPLLDQLNAEQELLNSEVTLVTARRDAYVAGFALLAAMGKAEAADLNFETTALYDPTLNYDAVRGRLVQFTLDPAPEAAGSGTRETPMQYADITPSDSVSAPTIAANNSKSR